MKKNNDKVRKKGKKILKLNYRNNVQNKYKIYNIRKILKIEIEMKIEIKFKRIEI